MFTVDLIQTDDQFSALEDEWRELVSQCSGLSYFLTWEFTRARWMHFAEDRQLWIVTVRNADGELVGAAPFAIRQASLGGALLRRLEFIYRVEIPFRFERYFLDGENLDIIAQPACRDAVAAVVFQAIEGNRESFDLVDLAWLSPESPLGLHLIDEYEPEIQQTAPCPIAVLPDSYDAYERDVLGKSESRRLRRYARRLDRDYPGLATIERINDRDDVVSAMANLDTMKRRRWEETGEAAADESDPHTLQHKAFERDFALAAFDRGWLRFYQLRVGDEIAGAIHCLAFAGVDYLINKGFEPEWKHLSPGNVLQAYEIEQAIAEGIRLYDFGHGWLETKSTWSTATREDIRLVAGHSWKGQTSSRLEMARVVAGSQARDLAKRLLSESSRSSLRRFVQNRTRALGS